MLDLSPFDAWMFTPIFPGEPMAYWIRGQVWFLIEPYQGSDSAKWSEPIPLTLYINQLLMKGKITF